MDRSNKIVFFCSNELHLRLYGHLFVEGIKNISVIYSLPKLYADGCDDLIKPDDGFSYKTLELYGYFSGRLLNQLHMFYAARKAFLNMLTFEEPRVLVLANDTGAPERMAIRLARSLSIKTLLIQDGFIVPTENSNSKFSSLCDKLKLAYAQTFGQYFGLISYGSGGCDVVAVTSEYWKLEFEKRQVADTKKIAIVGSPSMEFFLETAYAEPFNCDHMIVGHVTFFTTNFISGYRDFIEHEAQISNIKNIRKLLPIEVNLIVSLHPADDSEDYIKLSLIPGIYLKYNENVEKIIENSWLCITNFSSVYLTCVALGRVCILLGHGLRDSKYINMLKKLPGDKVWSSNYLEQLLVTLTCLKDYNSALDDSRDVLFSQYIQYDESATAVAKTVSLLMEDM